MQQRILLIFTRTPLHVGAGASVGAIDQPIIRERHTQFPIIPASSLKGSFADLWNTSLSESGKRGEGQAAWLFGSDDPDKAAAGALLFGEARLLAFPIRSARGSFAWITSPTVLLRAARDGILPVEVVKNLLPLGERDGEKSGSEENVAAFDASGSLAINKKVVLEDHVFEHVGDLPEALPNAMRGLLSGDPVWDCVSDRLVVVNDHALSHFTVTACEVAQHVRISDSTGAAEGTALFNQENVPSETLFYFVLRATRSRLQGGEFAGESPESALTQFCTRIQEEPLLQFGADASTGLGYCTVEPFQS